MVTGTIKLGKNTKAHAETLKAKGYEVSTGEERISIQAEAFVEKIEVANNEELAAKLREVVAEKKLLTYGTVVKVGDKEYKGLPLCWLLGPKASAFVVHGRSVTPKAASVFDEI